MKTSIDWSSPLINWTRTDRALAVALGVSRQNVRAARKRHHAPASPAGWGGARRGAAWARLEGAR